MVVNGAHSINIKSKLMGRGLLYEKKCWVTKLVGPVKQGIMMVDGTQSDKTTIKKAGPKLLCPRKRKIENPIRYWKIKLVEVDQKTKSNLE